MDKFVKFNTYDGGVVRVVNKAPYPMKEKVSITLNGKNNTGCLFCSSIKT